MKPGSFKPLELTAEFGTKNFLRELNKLNVTFHLLKLRTSGKCDLSSLKNFHFYFKVQKNSRAEYNFRLYNCSFQAFGV